MKKLSIRESRKSRHEYRGTKGCKAEEIRKYFVNPKTVIEVYSYIICSFNFKNSSCTLFLLHMKTMNGVVSWYILALHPLFHFIACVLFLPIFLNFFSYFVCEFYNLLRYWGKFGNTENEAVELFLGSLVEFQGWFATALFSN